MGVIKTIKNDDGKPYVSLEDMIKEFEGIKDNYEGQEIIEDTNFLEIVLKTFHQMEEEYYSKFLIKK